MKKIKCPYCGSEDIRCIEDHITMVSTIHLDSQGCINYNLGKYENGELIGFQCYNCMEFIVDKNNNNITDEEELIKICKVE